MGAVHAGNTGKEQKRDCSSLCSLTHRMQAVGLKSAIQPFPLPLPVSIFELPLCYKLKMVHFDQALPLTTTCPPTHIEVFNPNKCQFE